MEDAASRSGSARTRRVANVRRDCDWRSVTDGASVPLPSTGRGRGAVPARDELSRALRASARARARRPCRRASPARRAPPRRRGRSHAPRPEARRRWARPSPASTSNTGRQWWKSLWWAGKSSVSEPSGSRYRTHTGSSANSERTSSFVSASDVIPFTRTAKRSATRSSHPQRRSRPVTVPNSCPSDWTRSWSGPTISLGNGPSPTRVTYAFATPSTSSMRFGPIPKLTAAPAAIGLDDVTNGYVP